MLASSWLSYFVSFYLCVIACGVLVRRGFLPLHISALAGTGAFVFSAAGDGTLQGGAIAALLAVVVASFVGVASSVAVLRVRATAAALLTIALQFLFDVYVRSATWTGGTQGISKGIPMLTSSQSTVFVLVALVVGSALYYGFAQVPASTVITVDGNTPLLAAALRLPTMRSLAISGFLTGALAGTGGVVTAVQLGFVSPPTFSLYWSILYVSAVLLGGFASQGNLIVTALLFSLIPQVLRHVGLGTSAASAWRGIIVGALVFGIALLQRPRARPFGKAARHFNGHL